MLQYRLEYVLLSEHLSGDISDIYIPQPQEVMVVIDHKAVIVSFRIKNTARGSGFWKLKKSLLQDQEYVNDIKLTIKNTIR